MEQTAVVGLSTVGLDDLALVGGKAANLGELIRLGLPVPDGFVITTDAYRQLAAGSPDWATVSFPDQLRELIVDHHHRLGGGPVAVRSSATAEDLPGAAFAGQQDTVLDVRGEAALLDAVRTCCASLWNERAVAYRARLAIPPEEVAMAIVVQQMAPAAVAGVMFTADPVSGVRDRIVVEAAAGLGEAVVSGTVTPDHYQLTKDGTVTEFRAGVDAGGELDPTELRRLAGLAVRIRDHHQRPMDIEWAVVPGSEYPGAPHLRTVQILQARPITGLPPEPVELTRVQRKTNQIVLDYLPVRPYPLDMTTWTATGPADMLARMAGSIGARLDLIAGLHETDSVVDSYHPVTPQPTPAMITALPSLIRRMRRYRLNGWRDDPRYADFRAVIDRLETRSTADLDWPSLLRHVDEAMHAAVPASDLRVDYLPNAGRAMATLTLLGRVLGRRRLVADLFTGAPTITRAANDRLAELARMVPDFDEQLTGKERLAALEADPSGAEFRAGFEDFLHRYGARETVSPLLVSSPTWSDAPEQVLDLIVMLARTDRDDRDPVRDPSATAQRASEELLRHPWLQHPGRRDWVRRRIAEAQAGVGLREDTHYEMVRPLPALRRGLVEVGRRLAAAEVIEDADDVWHLRWSEIAELDAPDRLPDSATARLRTVIRQRAAVRSALGSTPLIKVISELPAAEDSLLTGSPASSGRATGPVRVVSGPAEFGSFVDGEVLVCPYTNPSWTPLFQRAVAVVADTGGPGSHAAIVAREYGIPAVMGTRDATGLLQTGQIVTVDGDHGRVSAA